MNGFRNLPAADVLVGGRGLVLNLLAERQGVFVRGLGVDGVGEAVLLGFAEVIDEQVAGDGGDPGDERAFGVVVGCERAVHLDEDLLGEVFGVVGRSGEAVADVVDTAVVGVDDFLPGSGVAGTAAADQHPDYLGVFPYLVP